MITMVYAVKTHVLNTVHSGHPCAREVALLLKHAFGVFLIPVACRALWFMVIGCKSAFDAIRSAASEKKLFSPG